MKRNDFLKILSVGSGTFILGSPLTSEQISYQLKEITVYDNYLNGVKYFEKDFLATKFVLGQEVLLVRESENIHDKFAIAVIVNSKKLGYLPAFENIVIANMMDKGVELKAFVTEFNQAEFSRYREHAIAIKITTQLMVPIQKIITEDLTKIE